MELHYPSLTSITVYDRNEATLTGEGASGGGSGGTGGVVPSASTASSISSSTSSLALPHTHSHPHTYAHLSSVLNPSAQLQVQERERNLASHVHESDARQQIDPAATMTLDSIEQLQRTIQHIQHLQQGSVETIRRMHMPHSHITDAEGHPLITSEVQQNVSGSANTYEGNMETGIIVDVNGNPIQLSAGVSELDNSNSDKKRGRKRKSGENSQNSDLELNPNVKYNVCLAIGCDRLVKHRRLCAMHQKQKERNDGKIELKENVSLKQYKGRQPTPFSKHANKYAKLKTFDKKIDDWAGSREEGSVMFQSYIESSYYTGRFPKVEDNTIYESIGKNIVEFVKALPEKSPLRKPLIKALSDNIQHQKLREVLPVSKQIVQTSKKLSDSDNLLLTIKYKPNVTRSKSQRGKTIVGPDGQELMQEYPSSPASGTPDGNINSNGADQNSAQPHMTNLGPTLQPLPNQEEMSMNNISDDISQHMHQIHHFQHQINSMQQFNLQQQMQHLNMQQQIQQQMHMPFGN